MNIHSTLLCLYTGKLTSLLASDRSTDHSPNVFEEVDPSGVTERENEHGRTQHNREVAVHVPVVAEIQTVQWWQHFEKKVENSGTAHQFSSKTQPRTLLAWDTAWHPTSKIHIVTSLVHEVKTQCVGHICLSLYYILNHYEGWDGKTGRQRNAHKIFNMK